MPLLAASPDLRQAHTAAGLICWREAGQGPALVLLHGIGSGADAWAAQFAAFSASHRVIAWDAPGYGNSQPLDTAAPLGRDYAAALTALLQHLAIDELVLVGHSLGALIAAAWAANPTAAPFHLRGLVLASPARGYGLAPAATRAAKYQERLQAIQRLGPDGLAAQRSAALCAPGAAPEALERVRRNMARVTPGGYAQAAHLLAHDDLLTHLRAVRVQMRVPVAVLCGSADRITLPADCAALASAVGAPFSPIADAGHACYVDAPQAFNAALAQALSTLPAAFPAAPPAPHHG